MEKDNPLLESVPKGTLWSHFVDRKRRVAYLVLKSEYMPYFQRKIQYLAFCPCALRVKRIESTVNVLDLRGLYPRDVKIFNPYYWDTFYPGQVELWVGFMKQTFRLLRFETNAIEIDNIAWFEGAKALGGRILHAPFAPGSLIKSLQYQDSQRPPETVTVKVLVKRSAIEIIPESIGVLRKDEIQIIKDFLRPLIGTRSFKLSFIQN